MNKALSFRFIIALLAVIVSGWIMYQFNLHFLELKTKSEISYDSWFNEIQTKVQAKKHDELPKVLITLKSFDDGDGAYHLELSPASSSTMTDRLLRILSLAQSARLFGELADSDWTNRDGYSLEVRHPTGSFEALIPKSILNTDRRAQLFVRLVEMYSIGQSELNKQDISPSEESKK